MKLKWARRQIHQMRSSMNVINGFIGQAEPSNDDESEFHKLTLSSMKKLTVAVDELSAMLNEDLKKKRLSMREVLK